MHCSANTTWLPVATFRRSLDDDEHVTSSSVNGVVRYRGHQDHHQDDRHLDHQVRFQGDRHQGQLVHQSRHLDDHPDHQDDLVRHLGDQLPDRQDDLRQDHPVRVCQVLMDALVHQYLQDHDQVHLQEYDLCEHQHLDQRDDHPSEDDQRQELRLDDQEEEELDDHFLEVAELDDHLDLDAVAEEDAEPKAQEL